MRTLPSRVDKQPSASFFANILAYLAETYPNAKFSDEDLAKLKPIWEDLWRAGRTAEATAQTTCSCNGKTLFPSASIAVEYKKGVARPPVRAPRGAMYGLTDYRESPAIERQKKLTTAAVKKAEAVNADIKKFVEELRQNPPRSERAADAKRARLGLLQQRLAEAIDLARAYAQQAAVARTEANLGWSRHLPGLPAAPKPVEAPEIVAKPKAKKAAAPKPDKKAGTAVPKPDKKPKDAAKPEKSKAKGKAAEQDKDAKMQAAIGAALAQQLEQMGFTKKS
jgi:hypothetical protein